MGDKTNMMPTGPNQKNDRHVIVMHIISNLNTYT